MILQKKFEFIKKLKEKYNLPLQELQEHIHYMQNFKVTTPIIGGFSTGKSTMINAFLGEKILRTNITAETAIPTEISYGAFNIQAVKGDNKKSLTLDELKNREFSIQDTEYIEIQTNHAMLAQLPTIKLVDMPGFDSGIQAHNTAIDQYLPKSLAYILTFSAEEPVMKESISDFLNELKIHDVPVYVCVTKADKVTSSTLEKNIEAIRDSVTYSLGLAPKKVVPIWAKKKLNENNEKVIDVNGLKSILKDIEENSRFIFEKHFSSLLKQHVTIVEQYLQEMLRSTELTVSELDEKEVRIQRDIERVQEKVTVEQKHFSTQLSNSITIIQAKINDELQANKNTLISMLASGQDIQTKLNLIVRMAITQGIKTEFEPTLQKHISKLSNAIQLDMPIDTFRPEQNNIDEKTHETLKNIALKSAPLIFTAIGVALTGPVAAMIIASIPIIADLLFNQHKEKEAKKQAEKKLVMEIIPQVLQVADVQVANELESYSETIHAMIQEDLIKKRDLLQKALEDTRTQKLNEQVEQQQLISEWEKDLEQVRGILNDAIVTM